MPITTTVRFRFQHELDALSACGGARHDVLILRLRRKIEPDPAHPSYIRTERGVGYLFDADVKVLR